MVTHWESSRRPLYVRTIWKDGQHHVILDKTKESYLDTPSSRRSKQSASQLNHRATRSAGSAVNFNVSSVRVLLSGVRRFKSGGKETRTREKSGEVPQSFNRLASNMVTCRNFNKEVTFDAIRGFRPPSLKKVTPVRPSPGEDLASEPTLLFDNALSKKVMTWLDLSTHPEEIRLKEKCVQAYRVTNEELTDSSIGLSHSAAKADDSSVLKNKSPRGDKNQEDIIVYSSEEVQIPDEEHFYHVLTPRTTTDDYTYREEYHIDEVDERKVNCLRRQLHIFMPNLPKKSSDCDSSIFSSKISVNCR